MGRMAVAAARLDEAASMFDALDMQIWAAATRIRQSQCSGQALDAAILVRIAGLGVANPEGIAWMHAPDVRSDMLPRSVAARHR